MNTQLRNWNDFGKFGIGFLTGESCAYNMRLLFDLDEAGKKHMLSFLGLPQDTKMNASWNSSVYGKPAVASILLTPAIFFDLSVFILFESANVDIVVIKDHTVSGYTQDQIDGFWPGALASLEKDGARVIHNPRAKHGRNQHQMSGRVE